MKDAATLAAQVIAANGAVLTRERGENKVVWTERVTGSRSAPIPPPTFPPPSVVVGQIEEPGSAVGLERAARLTPPGSTVSCTLRHTMWYPDNASVVQRAQAAVDAGWSGIVIWALGYEDATLWSALAAIAPQRANGPLLLDPIGSVDEMVVLGTRVRVSGWAADPEFDLPIPVAITVDGVVTTLLARLDRLDVANAYPGMGPFHGFTATSAALTPGNHTVCMTLPGWVGQPATPLGTCQTMSVPSSLS